MKMKKETDTVAFDAVAVYVNHPGNSTEAMRAAIDSAYNWKPTPPEKPAYDTEMWLKAVDLAVQCWVKEDIHLVTLGNNADMLYKLLVRGPVVTT